MNRVEIKEEAMNAGWCKAELVDQLCDYCEKSGVNSCPYVPPRNYQGTSAISRMFRRLRAALAKAGAA